MIFNSDGTYYFADSTFNFDGQLTYGTAAPAVPFTYFNDSLNAMATHSRIHINGDQLLIIEPGQVSGVEHIYYKRQ